MPSSSQAAATAGRTGKAASSSTTVRLASRASSLQTVPTPPRVASRSHRVDGAAASRHSMRSFSGAVSDSMSASSARSPRASMTAVPWSPMVPDESTTSPSCTRSAAEHAPGRDEAHAGGRDVHPVGRAPVDHLGVAGHDRHAGRRGRLGHVGHDLAQLVDGEPLLEHEGGRQRQRSGPHHGQVVDGAVHGQVAHRAAGEAQGLDHVGVGAEGQPLAGGELQHGGVRLSCCCCVSPAAAAGEGRQEHGVEQRGRGLAAGAVGQGHDLVEQAGSPTAKGLDALEDDCFPTGRGCRCRSCGVGHGASTRAASVMPSTPSSSCCTIDHSSSIKAFCAS